MVNAPVQAKYFYQDLDKDGGRLNGSNRYAVTFAKDQTPPVNGFWSLTLYSNYHFFVPNEINRYCWHKEQGSDAQFGRLCDLLRPSRRADRQQEEKLATITER
jgi:hypothetical protein